MFIILRASEPTRKAGRSIARGYEMMKSGEGWEMKSGRILGETYDSYAP